MKEWLEEMTDKKEEEFRVQFKDSIQIMAGALKAGYKLSSILFTFLKLVSVKILN